MGSLHVALFRKVPLLIGRPAPLRFPPRKLLLRFRGRYKPLLLTKIEPHFLQRKIERMPEHIQMRTNTREQGRAHSEGEILEFEPIGIRAVLLLGMPEKLTLLCSECIDRMCNRVLQWHSQSLIQTTSSKLTAWYSRYIASCRNRTRASRSSFLMA